MKQIWRILVLAVLVWQGAAAVWQGAGAAVGREAGAHANGLTADTDWRMRSILEDHAEVLDGVEQTIPRGDMILWRLSDPLARTNVNLPRARVGQRLRHLLYPEWFMTYGMPDAVGVAEVQNITDRLWLLVLGDEQGPAGRAGWTKELAGERYEIWQFQKD